MQINMPSFGGTGGLFVVSVTRSIVVLFCVHIGAVLLLRNASFRIFVWFRRTLCCFLEWVFLLSIVDSLAVLIMWNHCNNNGNFKWIVVLWILIRKILSVRGYLKFCRVETNLYHRVLSRECCLWLRCIWEKPVI
jgi:hypothetical protein